MKAIDPVCGMSVETETAAAKLEYEGQTYYFCSAHCAKAFSENPEQYVTKFHSGAHGHHGGGHCH